MRQMGRQVDEEVNRGENGEVGGEGHRIQPPLLQRGLKIA